MRQKCTIRKSNGVTVHYEKKSDGVRVYHEKKSDRGELTMRKKVMG